MKNGIQKVKELREKLWEDNPEFYNLRSKRTVGTREVEVIEEKMLQGMLESLKRPLKVEIIYE